MTRFGVDPQKIISNANYVGRSCAHRLTILTLVLLGGASAALLHAQRQASRMKGATSLQGTLMGQDTLLGQDTLQLSKTAPSNSIEVAAQVFSLLGVYADGDPKTGLATIALRDGSIALYRTGDTIQSGVRLDAVYHDSVLLDIRGTVQSLALKQAVVASLPPPRGATYGVPSAHSGRAARLPASGPLQDLISYSEVRTGGRLRAIQVFPGHKVYALQRLGLRPGDLVIAIGDTPVEEHLNGEHALELLGNSFAGQVTIVRNGSRQELTIRHADASKASY